MIDLHDSALAIHSPDHQWCASEYSAVAGRRGSVGWSKGRHNYPPPSETSQRDVRHVLVTPTFEGQGHGHHVINS